MPYRARWLRFLLGHWEEMRDDGTVPSALRDEYEHLGPGRLCSCGSRTQVDDDPPSHSGGYESTMPSATYLDIQVAYGQLPMGSRGRTEVWLLMRGVSEQSQYDMSEAERLAWHRQRIREETARPGYKKSPQSVGTGGSVWEQLARSLNGGA